MNEMPVNRSPKKHLVNEAQLSLFDALLQPIIVPTPVGSAPSPTAVGLTSLTEAIAGLFIPKAAPLPSGEITLARHNVSIIELLQRIQAQGRAATTEERQQLSQYAGWGGCPALWDQAMFEQWQACRDMGLPLDSTLFGWVNRYGPLRQSLHEWLSPEAITTAQASILSAYFTPVPVVNAIWQALQRLGFRGGRILEPGAGVGTFIGHMPTDIRRQSTITAIEKDVVSAQIVSVCYPEIKVEAAGFETVELPASFDLVIGNVPFGDVKVYDPQHKDICNEKIHNYFIAKSVRLLRPGGLLALITTSGTLDSERATFRRWLADEQMGLVGAIRLPGNVFGGTQVTTDVLFMQKGEGVARLFADHTFDRLTTIRQQRDPSQPDDTPDNEVITRLLRINEYFDTHPTQVIGEIRFADEVGQGGLYRADRATCYLAEAAELADRLTIALNHLPQAIYEAVELTPITAPSQPDGLTEALAGIIRIQQKDVPKRRVYDAYRQLKTAFEQLWRAEREEQQAEPVVDALRQQLRTNYLSFVSSYGRLNRNRAVAWLEAIDPQFPIVQALETVSREATPQGGTSVQVGEASILHQRVYPRHYVPTRAENLTDAIAICRAHYGRIIPRRIAALLDVSETEATSLLLREVALFIDPLNSQPIDAIQYLSGNVREKLTYAQQCARTNPEFEANVTALQAVQPYRVPAHLIDFGLGANWLPPHIISNWMKQQFSLYAIEVMYNPRSHLFVCRRGDFDEPTPKNRAEGTAHRLGSQLVEAALNHRTLVITKRVLDKDGSERIVRDIEATSAAVQAQERLQDLFVEFARSHADYAASIEETYNHRFCSYVPRRYGVPPFTHYPGASTHFTLRRHQYEAVSRALDQDCLYAQSVGSGKTAAMQTAGMELRRLGIARKVLYVVQNSTVADFTQKFRELYPAALLCVPTAADMEAKNRAAFLRRIATNAYDAIIMPQSFLKQIPDDVATVEAFIREEINRLTAVLLQKSESGRSAKKTAKSIENLKARILARRYRQQDRSVDRVPTFGELGIDALFLDEAHRYKRLGFFTNRRNVKGIDTQGSEDALSALMKCRSIQARRGRVVLATGTPISNTMAEAWTMLRFVAPQRLEEMHMTTFDEFAGAFGQVISSFELTAGGNFKAVDRFAKFVNIKGLSDLYRSHVDVVLTDDVAEFKQEKTVPQLKNGEFTRIILPQTPGVAAQMTRIRLELIAFEKMTGQEKRDNSHLPLVLFGQARKATLDLRLIDPQADDEYGSKTNRAVNEIVQRYQASAAYSGVQLVFADLYQSPAYEDVFSLEEDDPAYRGPAYRGPAFRGPAFRGPALTRQKVANRFNLFTDITRKLIALGVALDEIAVVPDEQEKREAVFARVRTGQIRVLMGSSERMGVGVNIQDRLCALHHLDAPMRPTDFEQRNGRILRPGNLHASWGIAVEVLTYGVDKTMDATAYGRLAIKQKFINQVLKGEVTDGSIPDISADDDFASLSFDQMMATLSGSTKALLLSTTQLEADRLRRQQKTFNEGVIRAGQIVTQNRLRREQQQALLPTLQAAIDRVKTAWLNEEGSVTVQTLSTTFQGQCTDEFSSFIAQFMTYLAKEARRDSDKRSTQSLLINDIPVDITAYYYITGQEVYFRYQVRKLFSGEFTRAGGFMTSLRVKMEKIDQLADDVQKEIVHCQQEEAAFLDKAKQVFPKNDQLIQLDRRIADLKRELEIETQEAEA